MASRKKTKLPEVVDKCSLCKQSLCCRYVTHNIDAPKSMADFDYLLWVISHNVHIFKDDDGWFLLINNPCEHLKKSGDCAIYEVRPQICRKHDNDYCEFDAAAEEGFNHYFTSYDQLEKYCQKRFKGWKKRFKKK